MRRALTNDGDSFADPFSREDSLQQSMQFSESCGPWQAIPLWAEFLIRMGLSLGDPTERKRRITIISMPCESAAAGLLAVGILSRRLTVEGANDSDSHFQRIEKLAIQLPVNIYLRHDNHPGRFLLEPKDQNGWIWVRNEREFGSRRTRTTRFVIPRARAYEWRFDGEPSVLAAEGEGLPDRLFYEGFGGRELALVPANLNKSDSAVCLAGRVSGESVTKSIMAEIQFRHGSDVVDLSRLLAVHQWSPNVVSRVTFFNTRTNQFDRNGNLTRLVVADGDSAFLRVVDNPLFRNCDVVGVIHRVVERDRLEAIGVKIAELTQWYTPDDQWSKSAPQAPNGITVARFRRK